MNACPKSRHLGFTLVELMIGVVILAILASVAMPSFQTWMLDTKIRNAAEAVQNGLQRARAEAVARNTNVAFTLGTDSSWTVSVVTPASVIESRLSTEGSTNVTRTVLPVGATTITFNSFGGVVSNVASLTQVDLSASGSSRNLRVTMGAGGNVRMCDPNLPSTNPRGC